MLQECTNQSIVSGALLGESLKLSPSPQLGHYYLVPFNDKEKGKVAQFQLGYKGYIQLAIRSGQYKKLNVMAIKEGELEYFDPLNEEIKINLMVDKWDEREAVETIGYYAMFELVNGFKKAIYWSKKQMESHALKYSAGFKKDREKGWNYTFWSKDFDGMAYKTMLRQLISKWGIMSIDMQTAFEHDMSYTDEAGNVKYSEPEAEEPVIIDMKSTEEPAEKTENSDDVAKALFG
jgi:recombination protein RecT